MKRVAASLAACLALGAATPARAVELSDLEMSVQLDVPDAQACVLVPEVLAVPERCAGVDAAQAARSLREKLEAAGQGVVALVRVRPPGGVYVVTIVRADAVPELDEATRREWATGVRNGLQRAVGAGATLEVRDAPVVTRAGGLQVTWTDLTASPPPGGSLPAATRRTIGCAVPTGQGLYLFTFQGDPAPGVDLRAVAEATLATIHGPPPPAMSSRRLSYEIGRLLGTLVGLGLVVGAVVLVHRRSKRRAARAAPPGGPV